MLVTTQPLIWTWISTDFNGWAQMKKICVHPSNAVLIRVQWCGGGAIVLLFRQVKLEVIVLSPDNPFRYRLFCGMDERLWILSHLGSSYSRHMPHYDTIL